MTKRTLWKMISVETIAVGVSISSVCLGGAVCMRNGPKITCCADYSTWCTQGDFTWPCKHSSNNAGCTVTTVLIVLVVGACPAAGVQGNPARELARLHRQFSPGPEADRG